MTLKDTELIFVIHACSIIFKIYSIVLYSLCLLYIYNIFSEILFSKIQLFITSKYPYVPLSSITVKPKLFSSSKCSSHPISDHRCDIYFLNGSYTSCSYFNMPTITSLISQSFLATDSSMALGSSSSSLQSPKYFPDTPSTSGEEAK